MSIGRIRKFKVIVVLMALLMFTVGTAYAMQVDYRTLNKMQGDWYNNNNNLVLAIHDNYINDCEVVETHDFAGDGSNGVEYFRIKEDTGYRDLKIEWRFNTYGPSKLIFNGQTLQR